MSADPTSLLVTDTRRIADLAGGAAVNRGRGYWRVKVATADHLVVVRAVDHVKAALTADAGPLRVGTVQHEAHPPTAIIGRLQMLRDGVASGRIVGVDDGVLDTVTAALQEDRRRWLVFAFVGVISAQCRHTVVYS